MGMSLDYFKLLQEGQSEWGDPGQKWGQRGGRELGYLGPCKVRQGGEFSAKCDGKPQEGFESGSDEI